MASLAGGEYRHMFNELLQQEVDTDLQVVQYSNKSSGEPLDERARTAVQS